MIYQAKDSEAAAIAALAAQMWERSIDELTQGFAEIIHSENGVIYLAAEEGSIIGFAQCSLRHDYVEGTHSSPVGYLEGIFVARAYRRRGYAKALLRSCEQWAKEQGCAEFASDCELTNEESLRFHLHLGFQEANRIICFKKEL
ncbi:MAG: GNAT family N-acetyltransferase [Oscillospiraceae bacterium]|nr:GNAT family N-acetyltransferase [Oscillospiraceae bacterium]